MSPLDQFICKVPVNIESMYVITNIKELLSDRKKDMVTPTSALACLSVQTESRILHVFQASLIVLIYTSMLTFNHLQHDF